MKIATIRSWQTPVTFSHSSNLTNRKETKKKCRETYSFVIVAFAALNFPLCSFFLHSLLVICDFLLVSFSLPIHVVSTTYWKKHIEIDQSLLLFSIAFCQSFAYNFPLFFPVQRSFFCVAYISDCYTFSEIFHQKKKFTLFKYPFVRFHRKLIPNF